MMWFVYILKCEDGSLYTGCTNNPDRRLSEHKNKKGGHYTSSHKVSERVIEKMQRDYAPGPYHPGFDPDKVNPEFFRNQQPPNYQQPNQPKYHFQILDVKSMN